MRIPGILSLGKDKLFSKKIINTGATKIEYLEVLDINKLIKPFKRKTLYKVFVAYYLNLTRLIDNI